jgi:DNA-binding CsgD family transcriptional regulator
MAMLLRMDANTIGLARNHDRVAFTRRDRLLLRLLQPHIASAYRRECGTTTDGSPSVPPSLTPREREVLHWAASGMTNQEIGRVLRISGRTVQVHLAHACHKLGARSRTGAVAALLMNGSGVGR